MPTRSEQRRINVQQGRPMNEGLEGCKTCKDCIHDYMCVKEYIPENINEKFINYSTRTDVDDCCPEFKDKSRYIELPCAVGDTVYCVYYEKVIQGTVQLVRPFVSKDDVVFKGNIICEIDSLFWDDGRKEEIELYVVFEKPCGMERVAYLIKEDAEKALKGGAE